MPEVLLKVLVKFKTVVCSFSGLLRVQAAQVTLEAREICSANCRRLVVSVHLVRAQWRVTQSRRRHAEGDDNISPIPLLLYFELARSPAVFAL